MLRDNYFCLFISALLILRTEPLANFVYFGQIRKSLWREKLIHNPIRESLCSQNFSRISKFIFCFSFFNIFDQKVDPVLKIFSFLKKNVEDYFNAFFFFLGYVSSQKIYIRECLWSQKKLFLSIRKILSERNAKISRIFYYLKVSATKVKTWNPFKMLLIQPLRNCRTTKPVTWEPSLWIN